MPSVLRAVEVEYSLGKRSWRRRRFRGNPEVLVAIGAKAPFFPRSIPLPASPQEYVVSLLIALGKHKLDGGFVHERIGETSYEATIVAGTRRERPGPRS